MNLERDDRIGFNRSTEFEQLYIDLRSNEKRIYTDEEVAWLPDVNEDHIHRKEWEIRKTSCQKLTRYLGNKKSSLKILEVGCGNGWLSYQLSQIPYSNIIGLDINLPELQQAERVFADVPNLSFIHGHFDSPLLEFEKFDVIVLASSIQYFNSFSNVIQTMLGRLNDKGEIHITDSHFYNQTEVGEAKQRSQRYFYGKGFNKMSDFYFHHTVRELDEFNYAILYDPNSIMNRVLRKKNPFHWICIKK
jgi:ubiquinone/menaquinone biosynthesis C-methylase UbiE